MFISIKQDEKVGEHLTYFRINKSLAHLYDELIFGECESGAGEEYSSGHKDSTAKNDTLTVAMVFLNQSSSDWCASQTAESDEKGRHSQISSNLQSVRQHFGRIENK
jgi:hypothetical protein